MASHRNMQIADNEDENHLDSVNCLETLDAAALVTIRGESVKIDGPEWVKTASKRRPQARVFNMSRAPSAVPSRRVDDRLKSASGHRNARARVISNLLSKLSGPTA